MFQQYTEKKQDSGIIRKLIIAAVTAILLSGAAYSLYSFTS